MTLKELVKQLNRENIDNNFQLSEREAKRLAPANINGAIVRFVNSVNWYDFTPGRVELYEWIPEGYPLSEVARRLDCSVEDIEIVAVYNATTKTWRSV